jgi:hypothetical protein
MILKGLALLLVNYYLITLGSSPLGSQLTANQYTDPLLGLQEIPDKEKHPSENGSKSKVLILQVDSRNIEEFQLDDFLSKNMEEYLDKTKQTNLPSLQTLSAAVNYMYACRQGYDYKYVHFNRSEGCLSPKNNSRSATWCKVPAIAWALQKYDTVLFLDSDTMVLRHHISIENWIKENEFKTIPDEGVNTPMTNADLIGSDDWNPVVIKAGTKINGGVLLFRKLNKYQEILKELWRHGGLHDRRYAHEQSVLSKEVFPKFRENIARVRPGNMNGVYGSWIRHFSGRRVGSAKNRFFAVAGTVLLQQAINHAEYPCHEKLLDNVVHVNFNELIPSLDL